MEHVVSDLEAQLEFALAEAGRELNPVLRYDRCRKQVESFRRYATQPQFADGLQRELQGVEEFFTIYPRTNVS